MEKEKIDVVKLFVKRKLDIPFSELEQKCMDGLDDEAKLLVSELINSPSYIDEVVNIIDNLIKEYSDSSSEENKIIIEKCAEKKHNLLFKHKQKNFENHNNKKR